MASSHSGQSLEIVTAEVFVMDGSHLARSTLQPLATQSTLYGCLELQSLELASALFSPAVSGVDTKGQQRYYPDTNRNGQLVSPLRVATDSRYCSAEPGLCHMLP